VNWSISICNDQWEWSEASICKSSETSYSNNSLVGRDLLIHQISFCVITWVLRVRWAAT